MSDMQCYRETLHHHTILFTKHNINTLSTYSQIYTQIYTIIFYKFHKCILRKEIAFEVSVTYREATQAHTLTHSHNRNSFFTYKHKHSPIHIHTFTYTGLIHDTLGLKCCIVMLLQCVGGQMFQNVRYRLLQRCIKRLQFDYRDAP